MTKNQLPEGLGKKIVEALQRQSDADITPVSSFNETLNNDIDVSDKDLSEIDFDSLEQMQINEENNVKEESDIQFIENNAIEEPVSNFVETNTINNQNENLYFDVNNNNENQEEKMVLNEMNNKSQKIEVKQENESFMQTFNDFVPQTPLFKQDEEIAPNIYNQQNTDNNMFNTSTPLSEEKVKPAKTNLATVKIPNNVAVLRNLILSLPVGVTKQTGAQIIRQTLEAMGLPMAGVLKEAQEVQETLNSNTRECMLKIQEFKTNIMQLEQSVQEYQKTMTQINDLVSLFLLTDRK